MNWAFFLFELWLDRLPTFRPSGLSLGSPHSREIRVINRSGKDASRTDAHRVPTQEPARQQAVERQMGTILQISPCRAHNAYLSACISSSAQGARITLWSLVEPYSIHRCSSVCFNASRTKC